MLVLILFGKQGQRIVENWIEFYLCCKNKKMSEEVLFWNRNIGRRQCVGVTAFNNENVPTMIVHCWMDRRRVYFIFKA